MGSAQYELMAYFVLLYIIYAFCLFTLRAFKRFL